MDEERALEEKGRRSAARWGDVVHQRFPAFEGPLECKYTFTRHAKVSYDWLIVISGVEKQATVIVDLDVALAVGPPLPNPWILALQMALKVAPPLEPESEPPVPTKAVLAMTEETMQATPSTSRARKKARFNKLGFNIVSESKHRIVDGNYDHELQVRAGRRPSSPRRSSL